MDRYYYLAAQLPTLFLGKKSSITIKSFLDEAVKWLTKKDFKQLAQIDIEDTSRKKISVKIYKQYQNFEYLLRKDLADYRRSVKKDNELKKTTFPDELVKQGDPLTIEKKLLQYRWDYIENLAKEHDFDIDAIVLYFLRLQINGKLSVFDKEKGSKKFRQTVDEKSYKKII